MKKEYIIKEICPACGYEYSVDYTTFNVVTGKEKFIDVDIVAISNNKKLRIIMCPMCGILKAVI